MPADLDSGLVSHTYRYAMISPTWTLQVLQCHESKAKVDLNALCAKEIAGNAPWTSVSGPDCVRMTWIAPRWGAAYWLLDVT